MKKSVIVALMLGSGLAHSETLITGVLTVLLANGLSSAASAPSTVEWHLVTVEWADGNQDTYRVRARSLNLAIERVEQRFAQSSVRAVYIHRAGFDVDMNKVLEIG